MEKFEWKQATKVNTFILKIVGLWPEGGTYKLNFYTLYAIFSINLLVYGHTFFQAMNIFFVYTDLEALTAALFVTSSEFLAAVKIYYYLQNLETLKKIKCSVDIDLFQPETLQQRILVQPSMKIWRIIYFGFLISCASTMALMSVFPILDHSEEFRLPFSAWYPFNTKASPMYEITYLYQVVGIWFLGTANINIDALISALMMYVGAQCDILSEKIRCLKNTTECNKRIINCVQHHLEILSFAKDCNRFFNLMVLGQFCTSVMSYAVTMFRLTVVAPLSSEFYSLLFYFVSVTTQVFLYCWFGNEVEIKNSVTYNFLYSVGSEMRQKLMKDFPLGHNY